MQGSDRETQCSASHTLRYHSGQHGFGISLWYSYKLPAMQDNTGQVQQSFRKLWSRSNSSPNIYRGPFNKSVTSDDWGPLPLLPDIQLPLHLQLEKRRYCDFSNYDNISCSSHIQKHLLVWSPFYWRCFLSSRHIHVLTQSLKQHYHGPQSHSCMTAMLTPKLLHVRNMSLSVLSQLEMKRSR